MMDEIESLREKCQLLECQNKELLRTSNNSINEHNEVIRKETELSYLKGKVDAYEMILIHRGNETT